jgi:hypothetical protein
MQCPVCGDVDIQHHDTVTAPAAGQQAIASFTCGEGHVFYLGDISDAAS